MTPPQSTTSSDLLTPRRQIIILMIILGVALFLRVFSWGTLDVEHFDEAVYASNYYMKAMGGETYPAQEMYAPPLVPQLLETVVTFAGESSGVLFGVNLVASLLTLILVWRVGTSWFGPVAGLAAASCMAASDFQISFSRSLMTEPIFGFFFLLAVWLMGKSFCFTWNDSPEKACPGQNNTHTSQEVSPLNMLMTFLAGVACSLCWVTKYNGWLPCAIIFTALPVAMLLLYFLDRDMMKKFHVKLLIVPGILVILGTFSLRGLHVWHLVDTGTYDAVNRNHAGYFVWWTGWWESFKEQKFQLDQSAGKLTFLLFASLLAVILEPWNWSKKTHTGKKKSWTHPSILLAFGILSMMLIGQQGIMFLMVTLYGLLLSLLRLRKSFTWNKILTTSILPVWWGSLLVAVPLYVPYPRLMYPWLIASWLGVGAALSTCFDIEDKDSPHAGTSKWWHWGFVLIMVGTGILSPLMIPSGDLQTLLNKPWCDAWENRTGMLKLSRETFSLLEKQTNSKDKVKLPLQVTA